MGKVYPWVTTTPKVPAEDELSLAEKVAPFGKQSTANGWILKLSFSNKFLFVYNPIWLTLLWLIRELQIWNAIGLGRFWIKSSTTDFAVNWFDMVKFFTFLSQEFQFSSLIFTANWTKGMRYELSHKEFDSLSQSEFSSSSVAKSPNRLAKLLDISLPHRCQYLNHILKVY